MRALLVDERIYNVRSGERGFSTYVSHVRIKHKEFDFKPEKDIVKYKYSVFKQFKFKIMRSVVKVGNILMIKADTLTDRWDYIDLMEAIAMQFVLTYHSTSYYFNWIEDHSVLCFLRYFLTTIFSTCVPVFFFANGYLLFNRRFSLKKNIIKTIRIIILTCVWQVITLLFLKPIECDFSSVQETVVYFWTWVQEWFIHLWYMGALVCIYILFPLLKVVFDNSRKIFIYFTVVCAILTFGNELINHFITILLNTAGLYEGIIDVNWFNDFNPFRNIFGYAFVYFCVGGLAHDFVKKIKEITLRKRNIVATIMILISCSGLFILGIVLSKISGEKWDVVWDGYDTIFTFINVCMIFVLALSYDGHNIIIKMISSSSLGIYFIHQIPIYLSWDFAKSIPFVETFVGCVTYSVITMAFSLALTQLFIRIPGLKQLVKL